MTPEERHAKQHRLDEINRLLGLTGPTEIDSEGEYDLQSEEQQSLAEERDTLIEELSIEDE